MFLNSRLRMSTGAGRKRGEKQFPIIHLSSTNQEKVVKYGEYDNFCKVLYTIFLLFSQVVVLWDRIMLTVGINQELLKNKPKEISMNA
jgi:hypothetical protein